MRRRPNAGEIVTVWAVDPLALTGIVTPGTKSVASVATNRVAFRDGVVVDETSFQVSA